MCLLVSLNAPQANSPTMPVTHASNAMTFAQTALAQEPATAENALISTGWMGIALVRHAHLSAHSVSPHHSAPNAKIAIS